MLSTAKPRDPLKVKAGKIGAAVRWADHANKTVRIDDLTADQRRLVMALVAAAKKTGPEISSPEPVTTGGTRDADRRI